MGTLRAHSRPAKAGPLGHVLYHTYVTCGTGHCWPCWGDCEGGAVLTTGTGSSEQAECLSEPDGSAGIHYALTGLCHQTANRILSPAGITVSEAIGYNISENWYGPYGSNAEDWIAHRDKCIGLTGEIDECTGEEEPEKNPSSSWKDALLSWLIGLYELLGGDEEPPGEETFGGGREPDEPPPPDLDLLANVLERRVTYVLGAQATFVDINRKVEALQRIQREIVTEKIPLDRLVYRRELPGREYAERVNRLFNQGLVRMAREIGEADYVALYKLRPEAEITVVRPEICELVYG